MTASTSTAVRKEKMFCVKGLGDGCGAEPSTALAACKCRASI